MEAFRGAVKPVETVLPPQSHRSGQCHQRKRYRGRNRVQTAMRERPRLRRVLITRRPV